MASRLQPAAEKEPAAPTGLGFNFPLYPALRLRLRAGLSCFVPAGLWCSDSYSVILSLAEIPRATNVSAAPPPSASLRASFQRWVIIQPKAESPRGRHEIVLNPLRLVPCPRHSEHLVTL